MIETRTIPLTDLAPNTGQIPGVPRNPRIIRDERFAKLVRSLKEDPEMLELRELLVHEHDGAFVVLGGNMRLKALKHLGEKEAPCKVIPAGWPAEKLRAIVTKDNVGFGEWDWEQLANEWDAEELADWGLDTHIPTNFDVDDFFKDSGEDGSKEVGAHSIVLNYTKDEHQKVLVRLAELGGSREQAVYKALGL